MFSDIFCVGVFQINECGLSVFCRNLHESIFSRINVIVWTFSFFLYRGLFIF